MKERAHSRPIVVEIDSIELVGFPRSHAEAIARAAESHLESLLQTNGLPQAPHGGRELRAPSRALDPAAPPSVLGTRVAEAVFEAMRGTENPR